MDSEHTTKRLSRAGLSCLFLLAVSVPCVSQQSAADPLQLQRSGVAEIDRFLEHIRSTGDAANAGQMLALAQAELQASDAGFVQRRDFGNAAWSAIKLGDIQR
jgi:hypothetical protein